MGTGFNAHLTIHGYIGPGSHKGLIPPAPAPAIIPHIAVDTLLGLTINAKYSKTVIGPFGFQLIGKDNDSGFVVPHFSIPMNNLLLPITILGGASKVMFGASTVKIDVDGKGVPCGACCNPWVPMSINQACNDPCNYPSDIVIAPNSVVVGLTPGDIAVGIAGMALDSAVSYALNKAFDKLASKLLGAVASKFANQIAKEMEALGVKMGGEWAKGVAKDIAANLAERYSYIIGKSAAGKVIKKLAKKGGEKVLGEGAKAVGAEDWSPVRDAADAIFGDAPIGNEANASQPPPTLGNPGTTNPITGNGGSNPNIHNAI